MIYYLTQNILSYFMFADGDDLGIGDDFEGENPDDNLTPVQKMEKYIDSENIFSR